MEEQTKGSWKSKQRYNGRANKGIMEEQTKGLMEDQRKG